MNGCFAARERQLHAKSMDCNGSNSDMSQFGHNRKFVPFLESSRSVTRSAHSGYS